MMDKQIARELVIMARDLVSANLQGVEILKEVKGRTIVQRTIENRDDGYEELKIRFDWIGGGEWEDAKNWEKGFGPDGLKARVSVKWMDATPSGFSKGRPIESVEELKFYGWNLKDMRTFGEKLWNHLSFKVGFPRPHGKVMMTSIRGRF